MAWKPLQGTFLLHSMRRSWPERCVLQSTAHPLDPQGSLDRSFTEHDRATQPTTMSQSPLMASPTEQR